MHSMPLDFSFMDYDPVKDLNLVAQNVPACTAHDMIEQAKLYIEGKLEDSGLQYMKQNNTNQTIYTALRLDR